MGQAAVKHRSDSSSRDSCSLAEELAEVSFFREQGLDEEAEACMQALRERYPGHPELAADPSGGPASTVENDQPSTDAWDDAYIASIFDEPAPKPRNKPSAPRVVTTNLDARSTLDVGFAFQEMGLTDNAAAAFRSVTSAPKLGAQARAMLEQLEGNGPSAPTVVTPRPTIVRTPNKPANTKPVPTPSKPANTKPVPAPPNRVATVRPPSKPPHARAVLARPNRVAAGRKASGSKPRPSQASKPSPQKSVPPTNVPTRPLAKVALRKVAVPKPKRAPESTPVSARPPVSPPTAADPLVVPVVAPPRYAGGLPPFEGLAATNAPEDAPVVQPARAAQAVSVLQAALASQPALVSQPAPLVQAVPATQASSSRRRRRPLIAAGFVVTGVVAAVVTMGVVLWPSPPDASPQRADATPPSAPTIANGATLLAEAQRDDADAPEAESDEPAADASDDREPELAELADVSEDDAADAETSEDDAAAATPEPRRRRRGRKKRRTAEPEPDPEPTQLEVVEPAPAPPKVETPPSAAELLRRASAAHDRGDSKSAYRLAKRSQDMVSSPKALELMVVSACKNNMGAAARSALRKLPLVKRSRLRRTCRQHGTRIPL